MNCIRFLDERVFATCSDDTSVAIWDARYLKSKVKTFQGHTNCVKNIEYSPRYILDEMWWLHAIISVNYFREVDIAQNAKHCSANTFKTSSKLFAGIRGLWPLVLMVRYWAGTLTAATTQRWPHPGLATNLFSFCLLFVANLLFAWGANQWIRWDR